MKKKLHYAWIVLVGCCGLTSTMGIILNTGGQWFASVTGELGFSTTELGLYLTVCSLGLGLAAPFVGRLLPKANIRVLLTACALASVAALGAMAFYDAPWQWWVSGAVIGLAGGFVFLVPAPIILGNWFAKKTGFVVGIAMACTGIAAAIMNPIVATLIASLGWRTTYLVTAAKMCIRDRRGSVQGRARLPGWEVGYSRPGRWALAEGRFRRGRQLFQLE